MLVLGDSIMWGQGLNEQNKISYQVQDWLCRKIQLPVKVWREAHSGAVLKVDPEEDAAQSDRKSQAAYVAVPKEGLPGEINVGEPIIPDQLDHAVAHFKGSKVDLVLMDGCINDFNFRKFINPTMTEKEIDDRAKEKCYDRMALFLPQVAKHFPDARIIVTGYYPVFTEKSARNLLLRFITGFVIPRKKQKWLFPNSNLFRELVATSEQFGTSSNKYLRQSVDEANKSAGGRIVFVPVYGDAISIGGKPAPASRCPEGESGFGSPCSGFAAPTKHSLLWTSLLNSTGRGRLSKFSYVLFVLNFHMLRPNDEVYFDRKKVCKEARLNFFGYMGCRAAAYGHPNRRGVDEYIKRVTAELDRVINMTGWLGARR